MDGLRWPMLLPMGPIIWNAVVDPRSSNTAAKKRLLGTVQ